MKYVAKALLGLAVLAMAGLAYVNASSETQPFRAGTVALLQGGINAESLEYIADYGYRAAMAEGSVGETVDAPEEVLEFARQSFAVDPLAAASIRTLILGTIAKESLSEAEAAMLLLSTINKRESVTSLWLAQNAIANGDVELAVSNFDILMSSRTQIREGLIGALMELVAQPEGVQAIAASLAREPTWEGAFWSEFATNPVALSNAEAFFNTSGLSLSRMEQDQRLELYTNLRAAGMYDDMFALAEMDDDLEINPDLISEGEFSPAGNINPFGWQLQSRGTYATRVPQGTDDLMIDARSNASGIVAAHVARLGGGNLLSIELAQELARGSELKLAAMCMDDGEPRPLAEIQLDGSMTTGQARLTETNCEFAELIVSFRTGRVSAGEQITVSKIALRPI